MYKNSFECFKESAETDWFLKLESKHQILLFRLANEYDDNKLCIQNDVKILLLSSCTKDDVDFLCNKGILKEYNGGIKLMFMP